jgi:CheY-like chemotaxis protein
LETALVSNTHHPRVLVVEDDEDCAMLLEEILTERGFVVEVAHDGKSALEAAERVKPEVGVLDVGLPDMDGFELARRLRKLGESGRTMRLIALSGYGSEDDIDEARAAGFDLHLTKPVLPGTLADALASCQPAREGPRGTGPS